MKTLDKWLLRFGFAVTLVVVLYAGTGKPFGEDGVNIWMAGWRVIAMLSYDPSSGQPN